MNDYDVIVVGGGGAGLAACAVASEMGARVLLVEAASRTGGSTAMSGGVFWAGGTSLQRENGIEDAGAEDMFRYYMTLNQHKVEASLVRRLCDESAPAFEWLRRIGVEFRDEGLYASGLDKVRRGHRAAGQGAAITDAIEGSFAGRGVDVALETRVDRLLIEDGRVVGILVSGEEVRSRSLVLATGGFGANKDKLARLYPDAAQHGDLHWYIGAPTCQGDGLDFGEEAGAALSPPNKGMLLLTPGFANDLESYLPGWLTLISAEGRRFIDETIEYSVLASVVNQLPRKECYGIFDEDARLASRTTAYRSAPSWTADRLEQSVDDGTLCRAYTLEQLAHKIGVPAAALVTAAERASAAAAGGDDPDFFKPQDMLRPIARPPFYAARIRAAILCWTGVGLRIDRDARVLGADGRPVPALFAAGETTGGTAGDCYAAGGASILNAVVFGRIAGANAAAEALA